MTAIYDTDGTSGSESGDDTAANNNNNNNNNENGFAPNSWRGWKERGKQAYLRGDYATALQNYSQALQRQQNILQNLHEVNQHAANHPNNNNVYSFPSRLDQQILLSNIVACRLQLGGPAQAEAAVTTAHKCIALDRQWAKGHLRLGEALIALGKAGGDGSDQTAKRLECSNKACDALQVCIDLDPSNQNARNLLTKELRYWAVDGDERRGNVTHETRNATSEASESSAPEPSAPPEHMDEHRSSYAHSSNQDSSRSNSSDHPSDPQQQETIDIDDIEDESNYVYTPSWKDRLAYRAQMIRVWYAGLSEDDRNVVHLAILFVVLYVAFGGRFGLEYLGTNGSTPPRRSDAVYEEFYRNRYRAEDRRHSYDHYTENSYAHYPRRRSSSSWSSSWGLGGGSYSYALMVLGLTFLGRGRVPLQMLFFNNLLGGRRNGFRHRRRHGWGRRGWGGGGFDRNFGYNPYRGW